MYFTSYVKNMFVYQPASDTLELKKDKDIDYVLSQKSKGVCTFKLKPLYTAFLNSIKLSRYGMGIKYGKDTLGVVQNNFENRIVNVYIAYDLDSWSRNPTNNFKFRNCLFGAISIVKNTDKEEVGVQWLWNNIW